MAQRINKTMYDFDQFVESVKDLEYVEILLKTGEEFRRTKNAMIARNARLRRRLIQYGKLLAGLLSLLGERQRPKGLEEREILRMQPVVQNLIRKDQLPPDILDPAATRT